MKKQSEKSLYFMLGLVIVLTLISFFYFTISLNNFNAICDSGTCDMFSSYEANSIRLNYSVTIILALGCILTVMFMKKFQQKGLENVLRTFIATTIAITIPVWLVKSLPFFLVGDWEWIYYSVAVAFVYLLFFYPYLRKLSK